MVLFIAFNINKGIINNNHSAIMPTELLKGCFMNNHDTAIAAFNSFQSALNEGAIQTFSGIIHKELRAHTDTPEGVLRFTYALMDTGTKIKSSCVAIMSEKYKDKPCFDIGITTAEEFRNNGFAKQILTQAMDELKDILSKNGVSEFYLEMKVDNDNDFSHKLCSKLADDTLVNVNSITYMRLIS